MIRVLRVLALMLPLAAIACGGSDSPSSPSENVPFSATDITVGTGAMATSGHSATISYTGWLYSASAPENKGTQFDSGAFPFTLGTGQVIRGFDQGVNGMKVGGTRRIVIPPDLGYGNNPPSGSGIPANATLLFEVTLTAVQ